MKKLWMTLAVCLVVTLGAMTAFAAAEAQTNATQGAETEGEGGSAFDGLSYTEGPAKVQIGAEGELDLPAGFVFFGPNETKEILVRMENLPSGQELGLVTSTDSDWFAVFSFDDSGYVEDSGDNADIDKDAILTSYKESMVESNKEMKKRGWDTTSVVGWAVDPYYNKDTKNLEWSMRFKNDSNDSTFDNYNVRVLGRGGVMKIILAGDSGEKAISEARSLLSGYKFVAGKTHAEYRQGDKLAGYGVAALIGGGVAAAALKSGFLQKFLKPILVGVVALFAGIVKFFRRKKTEE